MRTAFTTMLLLVIFFLLSVQVSAQDAYRTNTINRYGHWTNAAIWERFDSKTGTWVPANRYPTYRDGVITIQAGDSVLLLGSEAEPLMIDQVLIEKGAALVLTKNQDAAVILNNGSGNDMTVNGSLYIERQGAIEGKGRIQVNKEAFLGISDNATVGVDIVNDGSMQWSASGQNAVSFTGCSVTNNNSWKWAGGNLYADSTANFVNNGKLEIFGASHLVFANNKRYPSKFINRGSIVNTLKNFAVDFALRMDNNGIIGGVGTYVFSGGVSNAGTVSPGASPGHLTLGPGGLKALTINIEIATTGAVAGDNYDWLTVASLQDLEGAIINVTDEADDPVGTEYAVIDANNMPRNRPYPDVTVFAPSNFSWRFAANKLILKKIAKDAIPVSWSGFRAVAQDNQVVLHWNAARDKRTSHFIIEHSVNVTDYKPIGKVDARYGAAEEEAYSFSFAGFDPFKSNHFRIKQVNTDGRSGYSIAREVKFDKGNVVTLQINADIENDEVHLNVQAEKLCAYLSDQSGNVFQRFSLMPGQHTIYTDSLDRGTYRLDVFVKDVMIETKLLVKR